MTGLRWGVRTDVGRARSVNQDSVYARVPLFAVADGMGGAAAGDVASRVALETLVERVAGGDGDADAPTTIEALVAGIRHANRVVFERSLSDVELRGMGTTICAVALVREQGDDGERLCIVNVGDSRAYVVQDGRLLQITRDHSYVEDLVEAGEITREQARFHPKRNIVTRALGVDPDVEVDAWEVVPYAGDRYLVCSDGLFNEVGDDEVLAFLVGEPDAQKAADELTRRANEEGGHDNISVVVVDVTADDEMRAASGADVAAAPASTAGPVAVAPVAGTPDVDAVPPGRAPRRLSGRAVGFVVLLAAVVAVAIGSIVFYGRSGYFVGFADDNVAIYKGRPGGLLWLDPTVETTFPLTRASVPPDQLARLDEGYTFDERSSAEAYVANVTQQADELAAATSTTTTTAPPPTTTTIAVGTTLPPEAEVVTTTVAPPPPDPAAGATTSTP